MAAHRGITPRLLAAAASALVLLGANGLTGCRWAPKPLSSLYGEAAYSRPPTVLSEPPCPPGEAWGFPIQGTRSQWSFLIDGARGPGWLTLRPCVTFASAASSTVTDASFVLVSPWGSIRGTAQGGMEVVEGADGVDAVTVVLTVASGTRAYREARGELYLVGCRQWRSFEGVELRADRATDLAARCYSIN